MRDARLIDLRRRALRDPKLSGNAARLISLLVEWVYLEPIGAEDEFPMRWSLVAKWTGVKNEGPVYQWFSEAESAGYLRRGALKNCPPTRHYFFCLNSHQKVGIDSHQKTGNDSHQKRGNDSHQKTGDHISIPFRKELESQRESIGSLRSKEDGGGNGSLRSTEGEKDAARLAELFAAMKRAGSIEPHGEGDKGASSRTRAGRVPAKPGLKGGKRAR